MRWGGRRAVAAALLTAAGAAVSGCAAGSASPAAPREGQPQAGSARPAPVRTVVRSHPTYRAGQTGRVDAVREHAALTIHAGRARRSATRLSPSYGRPPLHGHYVTFRLTVVNTGRVPVLVRRGDFSVRTPGLGRTTTDDGNAPVSGSGSQLDTTQLAPGERVSNDLTFDVRHPTGTLLYAPSGRVALAWTF